MYALSLVHPLSLILSPRSQTQAMDIINIGILLSLARMLGLSKMFVLDFEVSGMLTGSYSSLLLVTNSITEIPEVSGG